VSCWGANQSGELGDGTTTMQSALVAVQLANTEELTLGASHTRAQALDGSVRCWGSGATYGAVGDAMNSHAQPTLVAGLDQVVQLGGGAYFNCALRMDQTV
jgi:alpha-tubulin suppressor-like RCC1 family protein